LSCSFIPPESLVHRNAALVQVRWPHRSWAFILNFCFTIFQWHYLWIWLQGVQGLHSAA
jgi:hypothetical protein